MADGRRQRGITGEDAAAAWYQARGYEVVARNWRCREGEIDLILRTGRTIVFCEVKSRRTASFGHPQEAVTPDKQRRVRRLAATWMQDGPARPAAVRFDVAAVLGDELEVIEGAF